MWRRWPKLSEIHRPYEQAVVLFLEKVEQVNMLVETGIIVGGQFVQVTPLTQPVARIILSNVPPFISDEFLSESCPDIGSWSPPLEKCRSESCRC